jgi:hypothetical protein
MEKLGNELSNDEKAEVFELTVTIHNNLSLCFMKMNDYAESLNYALNASRLVEALEAQATKTSLVFEALKRRNSSIKNVDAIRKLWRRKSLFYAGKAEFMRKNYVEVNY